MPCREADDLDRAESVSDASTNRLPSRGPSGRRGWRCIADRVNVVDPPVWTGGNRKALSEGRDQVSTRNQLTALASTPTPASSASSPLTSENPRRSPTPRARPTGRGVLPTARFRSTSTGSENSIRQTGPGRHSRSARYDRPDELGVDAFDRGVVDLGRTDGADDLVHPIERPCP